jgi:hypothetical protein
LKLSLSRELLEQLGVVLEHGHHHPAQGAVVFDACVLGVAVALRVLIRLVGCDAAWDVLGDEPLHAVRVGPVDVAELVVERAQDVGEPLQLRVGLAPSPAAGTESSEPSSSARAILIVSRFSTR